MTTPKIDIAQQIDKLIDLQAVDAVIYKLKAEKQQKPLWIEQLKLQFEDEKKAAEDAKNSFKQLQVKKKEKEIELEIKETGIKKLNVQLYQLKTNKEYEAMQQQIGLAHADCSVLEEDILKLMDAIEQEEKNVSKKQKEIEQKQQEINAQIKQIEQQISVIEADLLKEEEKRKAIAFDVDHKILSHYERILEGKDGFAMAPIVEHTCGGCHMQLPPQVINEIRLKQDIIYCHICSRMLYDKGEDNSA